MPRGRPVDDKTRERARELIRDGVGRNDVARQLGIAAASVTMIAKAAGLDFSRSATAVAVEARRVDRAARRGLIIDRLYDRAERVMSRLEAELYTYTVIVPGQGPEAVHEADPPARDEKDLASAVGAYLSQAAKLEDIDGDSSSDAKSMLADLGRALGIDNSQ